MKTFLLILVLAVLAAAAIRVWLVGTNESEQFSEVAVATGQTDNIVAEPLFENPIEVLKKDDEGLVTPNLPLSSVDDDQQPEEEIPVIYESEFVDIRDVIAFLGEDPDQFMAYVNSWYTERGMNFSFGGPGNEAVRLQPYGQYDEETLMSFAESGDPWAQQILGQRWSRTRPVESIGMLKSAAEQGSAMAMVQIAGFYNEIAQSEDLDSAFSGDAVAQIREILETTSDPQFESAVWLGAAEIASGGWMSGPDRGQFTQNRQANLEMSAERQREICGRALQTYNDMRDARISSGQQPIPITAPPFLDKSQVTGYCDTPDWPRPDTSHCQLVKVARHDNETTQLFGICPPSE